MLNSDIVEVAIGLAFMYFVLSLVCSTITELIARLFALRAMTLEGAVRNLLSEAKPSSKIGTGFFKGILQRLFSRTNSAAKSKIGASNGQPDQDQNSTSRLRELADVAKDQKNPDYYFAQFYSHPIITQLSRQGTGKALPGRNGRPSYISSHDFALVLLDVILPADGVKGSKTFDKIRERVTKIESDPLKKTLLVLLDEADDDVKKLREGIENWFNANMDRVEGWYRRKAQLIALVLAAVVVVALNADTLAVAKTLSTNASVRSSVVAAAQEVVKNPPKQQEGTVDVSAVAGQVEELTQSLQKPGFPVGWQMPLAPTPPPTDPTAWDNIVWWFYKLVGLAMTALLISLGAPFWFDLLNKLVNLRGAGKPPEPSTPEKPQAK